MGTEEAQSYLEVTVEGSEVQASTETEPLGRESVGTDMLLERTLDDLDHLAKLCQQEVKDWVKVVIANTLLLELELDSEEILLVRPAATPSHCFQSITDNSRAGLELPIPLPVKAMAQRIKDPAGARPAANLDGLKDIR